MPNLPGKVAAALEKLRADSPPPPYIILRKIHGGYYVYKDLISKDNAKGKKKLSSEYIGRITDDGVFIKRAITKDDELENARAVIEARGGKVILPERTEVAEPARILSPDRIDNEILTILSMNARATLPFIAKRVGLSVSAVDNRIRHLEKRYGIKYIAEIDVEKLGYLKFIIFVKFIGKVPSSDEIRKVMKDEIQIQTVVMLNGEDYDMMLYILAEKNIEVSYLIRDLRSLTSLANYPSRWLITPFYETYNFMPLRENFVDSLKDKLGKNKIDILGEEITKNRRILLNREFAVLKELNSDGRIDFTSIDKKYGFDSGRTQYSYHKLLENGLLKRITITMSNLPVKYIALVFLKNIQSGIFYATRKHLLENIISENDTPVNKYNLVGDIGLPYGILFFFPVFNNGDIEKVKGELSMTEGIELSILIVSGVVIGGFCFRKFDNAYSRQSDALSETFGERHLLKADYS